MNPTSLYLTKFLKNSYINTYLCLLGYEDDKEYYYQIKQKYPDIIPSLLKLDNNLNNPKYVNKYYVISNKVVFIKIKKI